MKELDDISLVTQVAVFHNRKAFDKLVVKYQSPIRRFFLNQTLGDAALSDDLAQECFVKAYVNIRQFRGLSGFSTWLYRIAYNVYYDSVRRHKLTTDLDTAEVRRVGADHVSIAEQMDIYKALEILSETERLCVTLQLMEGHPIDKISEITHLPQGTVKSHLSRSKQKLAKYLKQNGYEG